MNDRVSNSAIRLTLHFTPKEKLPKRLTAKKDELFPDKKKDEVAEANFRTSIIEWEEFINAVLKFDNTDQVWRFLNITPLVENDIKVVSRCRDFINFTKLFIKFRDNKKIDRGHIGMMSLLHTTFQHEIERKLGIRF